MSYVHRAISRPLVVSHSRRVRSWKAKRERRPSALSAQSHTGPVWHSRIGCARPLSVSQSCKSPPSETVSARCPSALRAPCESGTLCAHCAIFCPLVVSQTHRVLSFLAQVRARRPSALSAQSCTGPAWCSGRGCAALLAVSHRRKARCSEGSEGSAIVPKRGITLETRVRLEEAERASFPSALSAQS